MPRPAAPTLYPGLCTACGYRDHPAGCAVYPCHRCNHDRTVRNDGTRGYVVEDFLTCPCACHRWWRKAYDATLDSGTPPRFVPAERPRGRHTPEEGDFA